MNHPDSNSLTEGASPMIAPYTDLDYKKYAYAEAQGRLWRVCEIIATLNEARHIGDEDREDIECVLLDCAMWFMREAVFVGADEALTREEQRKAEAAQRRAEQEAWLKTMDTDELRERLQRHCV